ncbi:concanavalin A-like lectin/glucanase domain-containing protein [Butyriboletus roseoflavus]|nr:concanavalin A-like lectin/glucanase domain-containing protein [Butyriboletus roseoflavus]
MTSTPAQPSFFIGEEQRVAPASPNQSRPSSAGTNPFSSPVAPNFDLSSRVPTPGETEPEAPPRQGISIAAHPEIPRTASYYGNRSSNQPSRNSSGIRIRESLAAPPSRFTHSTLRAALDISKEGNPHAAIEKPWVSKKDPYARIAYFLTYSVAFIGIAASAIRCYFGYTSVQMITGNLCMVPRRRVRHGHQHRLRFWRKLVPRSRARRIWDGYLYITPTLTSDIIGMDNVLNGYTYNLTDCTYNATNPESLPGGSNSSTFDATAYYQTCGAVSNSSTGAVINPVQSARISTRNSASIRYGRVEVRAKLPRGDWVGIRYHSTTTFSPPFLQLWPAIWMLPVNNTYGPWPQSGEIDIMESRGNGRSYPQPVRLK